MVGDGKLTPYWCREGGREGGTGNINSAYTEGGKGWYSRVNSRSSGKFWVSCSITNYTRVPYVLVTLWKCSKFIIVLVRSGLSLWCVVFDHTHSRDA